MDSFSHRSPEEFTNEALKIVGEVHSLYHAPSFTNLQQDFRHHGPEKFPPKAGPYDRNPPPPFPYKDQTLWESMSHHFAEKCPEPSAQELQSLARERINYRASSVQKMLLKILTDIGNHRPDTLEEARDLLDQTEDNLLQVAEFARHLSSSKCPFSAAPDHARGLRSRKPSMDGELFAISRRTGGKYPWSDLSSFSYMLDRKQYNTQVLTALHETGHWVLTGYVCVQKTWKDHAQSIRPEVYIVDSAAYKVAPDSHHGIPGFADALVGDFLDRYYTALGTDDMGRKTDYPHIYFDLD